MNEYDIEDILALVEKPSRYLGTEINAVKKDFQKARLRIVLAFPDLYEIGSSHFGMQILYHVLNQESEILVERVFAPGMDMQALLKAGNRSLFSLETRHPVNQFDIIGFSLLTELNYTNVLNMLELSGVQLLAAARGAEDPVVIAGGPCTCNPEPVAQFFDAMVVGDGEPVVIQMARSWLRWKESGAAHKEELLHLWAAIDGVYIPSFFEAEYDAEGFQRLVAKDSRYRQVSRSIAPSLDQLACPTRPIVPFGKPVHDRLRLEIARGCSRGCRFCQAGMIYRPVRERSPETLLSLTEDCIAGTGYEDLSLLSLSSGDYGCVIPLMQRLMERHASNHLAVSLPSLRAGTLTPELMTLIKRVRKTGFTIAPEAGSQRLRDVINKNVAEEEIRETVRDAVRLGWRLIKLYFMIGLPTETEADLQALIRLVTSLQQIKGPKKERMSLNVGVATFIPKPHTPFQWASQIPLAEARRIMDWLKDRLKTSRIQLKWQNPEVSCIEAVLARGDRRLSQVLLTAQRKGCLFDSWTDQFKFRLWQESFQECGVDPDFYTTRVRSEKEPLPWDHIDIQVAKKYLAEEWREAVSGNLTPDCRAGECRGCGVCDFERVSPQLYTSCHKSSSASTLGPIRTDGRKEIVVDYSKRGEAKYFGHLELANIFSRAIRRTGVAVRYSEGFHPKPRISFDDPLPIGMESQSEVMYVQLENGISMEAFKDRLNEELPAGLVVNECRALKGRPKQPASKAVTYEITLAQGFFDDRRLRAFEKSAELMIVRSSAKGVPKRINLREAVIQIERLNGKRLRLRVAQEPGKTVRPAEFLQHVLELEVKDVKTATVVKIRNGKNTSNEMI